MILIPLLAVHLSDGYMSTSWQLGGFIGMAVLLLIASYRLKEEWIPRIGVLSAAFFISSSLHLPLFVTNVHLLLNGLVGVILGRRAPLAIAVGLLLQAFLLGHGGRATLGLNTCIMGLPALIAGVVFPIFRRMGIPSFRLGFLLGFGTASATVMLNFFAILAGGKEYWEILAKAVLVAHVPIVLVEDLMLGVVVSYLEKVSPDLLGGVAKGANEEMESEKRES